MNKILLQDGTVTKDEWVILQEQAKFYKKLYTKNPDICFVMENHSGPRYSQEEQNQIDEPFQFEDFTRGMKAMARNKAPGNDGLPVEFYAVFWQKIGKCVWEAMLDSHRKGHLYKSARRGVISLIPKKNKNSLLIKNWRPLTLLNTDHKILTKMLTSRLKPYLEKVIGLQQTGYVPGRYIGTNIRKMIDLLMYLEQNEIEAVLVVVDFEKCFDTIEHESLVKALRFFNVGEYFISWVKMLYNNFELCVINNGKLTHYFMQGRGVHQGSALSGPLFLCVAKILALNIKNNKQIEGIPIKDRDLVETIAQYADDTNIWSLFKHTSLTEIVIELEKFYQSTGLKANFDRTTIFRVGALKGTTRKLKLTKDFKWANGNIDTLGMVINIMDLRDLEELNFERIIEKAQGILEVWSNQNSMLFGKIETINALVGSLFVCKMQNLPLMSKSLIAKIKQLLSKYIWNACRPKIRNEILTYHTLNGGRKLVNLEMRDMAVKIEWIN